MKVPEITEEERTEIFIALRERKESLEKLEKDTDKKSIPIDHIEERLQLYRDREGIENGARTVVPGLLAIFADTPELSTEARENQQRPTDGAPDLFGGGAETGGGRRDGAKQTWKEGYRPHTKGHKNGDEMSEQDATGEGVITPPAPRAPLGLPAAGTPSNNTDIIDPTPNRPNEEGIAELRQAVLLEPDPETERVRSEAGAASPAGTHIRDPRAVDDTRMGTGTDDI